MDEDKKDDPITEEDLLDPDNKLHGILVYLYTMDSPLYVYVNDA